MRTFVNLAPRGDGANLVIHMAHLARQLRPLSCRFTSLLRSWSFQATRFREHDSATKPRGQASRSAATGRGAVCNTRCAQFAIAGADACSTHTRFLSRSMPLQGLVGFLVVSLAANMHCINVCPPCAFAPLFSHVHLAVGPTERRSRLLPTYGFPLCKFPWQSKK